MEFIDIKTVKCNVEINKIEKNFELIKELVKKYFGSEKAYILLKERNHVLIGELNDGKLMFYENALQDMELFMDIRIFNEVKELYFWNIGKEISYRFISNIEGENSNVYNYFYEKVLLWGTVKNVGKDYLTLKESKIKELKIPIIKDANINDDIYLKIQNYICKNEEDGVPYIKFSRLCNLEI